MSEPVVRPRVTPERLKASIRALTAGRGLPPDDVDAISGRIFAQVMGSRMPRWCVVRLEWDNMMKYGPGNVINFEALRGHLSGIVAPNDSGKSSIIDILAFALYGESLRATKHTIERVGKGPTERSWTSVCVRVWTEDGSVMYRVDRVVRAGRSLPCAVFAARPSEHPVWVAQKWGNALQVSQKLKSLIGDLEMFRVLALSIPGDVSVCNCDYGDRLNLFAHLFGFSGLVRRAHDDASRASRDLLRSELAGLIRAGASADAPVGASADTTMGMPASEIEWLREKFDGKDASGEAARIRREIADEGPGRDAHVVHLEYERAVGALRQEMTGASTRGKLIWNDGCTACQHNQRAYPFVDDTRIEELSAERDRLAQEYVRARYVDRLRTDLLYAEKYIVWSGLRQMAAGNTRVGEIEAELAVLDNEIRLDDLYNDMVKDGVVAMLMCTWYTDGVILQANALLKMMQCPFILGYETPAGGLKFTSRDMHTGIVVPLELGGAFQRFACGLAIRASLIRYNGGPDLLIVDEGFDCMDSTNRYKCIEVFPTLVKIFKVFMVVSHLEPIRELLLAEYRLSVVVVGGMSRVGGPGLRG